MAGVLRGLGVLAFLWSAAAHPEPLAGDFTSSAYPTTDNAVSDAITTDFIAVAGKDYIEFPKGSYALSPPMRIRLERQALFLSANPDLSFHLVATGDGSKPKKRDRLAIKRAEAVKSYLVGLGIARQQIANVIVGNAPTLPSGRVQVQVQVETYRPVRA